MNKQRLGAQRTSVDILDELDLTAADVESSVHSLVDFERTADAVLDSFDSRDAVQDAARDFIAFAVKERADAYSSEVKKINEDSRQAQLGLMNWAEGRVGVDRTLDTDEGINLTGFDALFLSADQLIEWGGIAIQVKDFHDTGLNRIKFLTTKPLPSEEKKAAEDLNFGEQLVKDIGDVAEGVGQVAKEVAVAKIKGDVTKLITGQDPVDALAGADAALDKKPITTTAGETPPTPPAVPAGPPPAPLPPSTAAGGCCVFINAACPHGCQDSFPSCSAVCPSLHDSGSGCGCRPIPDKCHSCLPGHATKHDFGCNNCLGLVKFNRRLLAIG